MPKKSAAPAVTYPAGSIVGTDLAELFAPDGSGDFLTTAGDDTIYALGGDDTVYAGAGADTVDLGAGNDIYWDGAGDDIVEGGTGGDVFYDWTGSGNDTYNGGADWDVVIYDQPADNYTIETDTVTTGHGRNTVTTVTEVRVIDNTTGEIDYLHDIEDIIFYQPPQPGVVTTQGDADMVAFDGTVTLDVLANDYIEGQPIGTGLTITDILDVQIDLDGDGINDLDLIPDSAEGDPSYFIGGGILNDGSILTLNADDTLTWDPNGAYDVAPADGSSPAITFWYEASDGAGGSDYADVTIQVTYPAAAGNIGFEDMVSLYPDWWAPVAGWIYQDGPNLTYQITELNSATGTFEQRDLGATNFDYDGDGDDEFRVWTEAGGTTHEMNVHQADVSAFDLLSMTITGMEAGETGIITFADGSGQAIGTAEFTSADLGAGGLLEFTNATDVIQFTIEAAAGDEFWIDDIQVA